MTGLGGVGGNAKRRDGMKTNYWAVLVAGVAYWILGALWFGLIFGKTWVALENIPPDQLQTMASRWTPYPISFVLDVLIAFVLAQICLWRGVNTAARGVALGILVWVGFVGPTMYTNYMYEMRPNALFAINGFYPLAGLCLIGAIVGGWTKKAA
jgi:hypothetical protein